MSVYRYNTATQEQRNYIFEDVFEESEVSFAIGAVAAIYGKLIPMSEYPTGSYFNRSYGGGTQCLGFANYVSNYL